ncbi:MAG TPA: hypothetical protein VIG69_03115 [Candidatus Methylomirabilis sp.]
MTPPEKVPAVHRAAPQAVAALALLIVGLGGLLALAFFFRG